MNESQLQVFLASSDYEADLLAEIKYRTTLSIINRAGSVIWTKGSSPLLWWPQWQLQNIKYENFESISQAIKILKANGKFWLNMDYKFHRRSALIQEGLPKIKKPDLARGKTVKSFSSGAWFLEEPGRLCFSTDISIPYRNGLIPVAEDKQAPSRAYQKLDEVFYRLGRFPSKSEKVIDLGSYPGGWTWVLSQLAGQVISVDTVALEGKMTKISNVEIVKKDAFKLLPQDIGPVDWLFSDIICEPSRLFALVNLWRDSGLVKNFVCTIKFKGNVDFDLLAQFQAIENSKIFHMNANKHELTWVCIR